MVHTDRKVVKSFVRWRGRRDESVADTEWSTEWNTRCGTLRCVLVLCTIITKLSACYKYTINYIYTYMEWNVKCVGGDTLQPVWAAASDNQLTALPQPNPLFLPLSPHRQSWPFQATSHNYFLFFYRSNCNRFNLIAKLMLGACSVGFVRHFPQRPPFSFPFSTLPFARRTFQFI